uniref:Uncharacterized protein n=1 Tax=Monodelphis domestica TaxID=13616 RepID=A0A5F8GJ29_MONDO
EDLGSNLFSDTSCDSAPDCWDQADMEAPGPGGAPTAAAAATATAAVAEAQNLSAAFSRQLNVNAKPFVPNVHAAEFVPSFLRGPVQQPPPPPPPPEFGEELLSSIIIKWLITLFYLYELLNSFYLTIYFIVPCYPLH